MVAHELAEMNIPNPNDINKLVTAMTGKTGQDLMVDERTSKAILA